VNGKSNIDLIKENINIVDFLKNYINLIPTGKNFKALCPFHQEKTPSFFVSPDKKIWHCFGCGLGGDVIRFIMLYEHLEFPEALNFLAEKAGVEIHSFTQTEQREFNILFDIHKLAAEFYKEKLKKNIKVLNYLKERGLKEETIDEFDLGFAPQGEELTKFLLSKRFNIKDIIKAGLTQKNVSGLYRDKFQNRIIFPIANQTGKIVAFTGRIVPNNGYDPEGVPKYVNSPETLIFNKSKSLYRLDKSKQFILEKKGVIIVEGQLDFLTMWQSGFKNVVAISGTGLTEEHLVRLKRLADVIFLSFDKDKAGIQAMERSLEYFYKFDFFVKVLDLKGFKDPAEVCKKSPEEMKKIIDESKAAFEYLMDIYLDDKFFQMDIQNKKHILRHLLKLLSFEQSSIERGFWIEKLSSRSGISQNDLREEFTDLDKPQDTSLKEAKNIISPEENGPEDNYKNLMRKLFILSLTDKNLFSIIKNDISNLPSDIQNFLDEDFEKEKNMLELEADYFKGLFDKKAIQKEFNDLVKKIKIIHIKNKLKSIKEKIKKAEKEKDENVLINLLKDFNEQRRELDKLQHY